MKLRVGTIYKHSSPDSTTRWKIVSSWNVNMFEGRAADQDGNVSAFGKSVMFNAAGQPIGAQDTAIFNPNGWYLVEEQTFEVFLLYKDGSGSRWEKLTKKSPWCEGTQYVVRETGKLETVSLMNHKELLSFIEDENID